MYEPINPLRQKYLDHISKQKSSGLSIKKYCQEHDLVPHKFGYYRTYKVKSKKANDPKSVFASVKLKSTKDDSPETNKMSISAKIDPAWLAEFIHNLMVER